MNKKNMPFDLFTALKIQAGITKGRFVTRSGKEVRILCFNAGGSCPIVALVKDGNYWTEKTFTLGGLFFAETGTSSFDLLIELEEDEKC